MVTKLSVNGISQDENILHDEVNKIIYIKKNSSYIVIDDKLFPYIRTLFFNFDYYFNAVQPEYKNGEYFVDYSKVKKHKLKGFTLFDPYFPSIPDPYITSEQYIDILKIEKDDVILDLGAYSGITSIAFAEKINTDGKVIAVEPDSVNYECLIKNINEINFANKITVLNAAIWKYTGTLDFSQESSMGSSAVEQVGSRGQVKKISCFKLSDLAKKFNLNRVNKIKCDIEGAESYIFEDEDFFLNFKPLILVESHKKNGQWNLDTFIPTLKKYGYKEEVIDQIGLKEPLVKFEIN